jgi:hypothetical protein
VPDCSGVIFRGVVWPVEAAGVAIETARVRGVLAGDIGEIAEHSPEVQRPV